MPIRINLLAEAQAAEELRRKDPVKRTAYGGGFVVFLIALWALTLQLKIMTAKSDLNTLGTKWTAIEPRYNVVVQRKRQAIEAEEKLAALDRLTTNRFLWANALNAFQQTLTGLDGIQVARIRTDQSYTGLEENKSRALPGGGDAKSVTATEKISVTLEAIDFSQQPGAQVNKFKEAIASAPYFKKTLQTNGVLLTSLGPPQVNEIVGTSFVKFTLQCFFPEKVRQ